jgi:hypothetical protein
MTETCVVDTSDSIKLPLIGNAYDLKEAFQSEPVVMEADANEPPLPGKISAEQAWQFAKALGRGQKDGWALIKSLVEDKVREVTMEGASATTRPLVLYRTRIL